MKLRTFQVVKLFLFIFALIITLLTLFAPIYQPSNTVKELSGSVGIRDNKDIISHMQPPWNYIYTFGDVWCHQKSERSFFIKSNQMPVCARCVGIFFGVFSGLGISTFIRMEIDKNIHKKVLLAFVVGYAPLATDVIGQSAELWHSTNALRVLTGTLSGSAFGFILGVAVDVVCTALSSSVFWSDWRK